WRKSRASQAGQPARGAAAETSDHSLFQRSKESRVRRIASFEPVRNLMASVTAMEAARFTAVFRIPAVSHVSTAPLGGSGKRQARQAVSPGKMFRVTA